MKIPVILGLIVLFVVFIIALFLTKKNNDNIAASSPLPAASPTALASAAADCPPLAFSPQATPATPDNSGAKKASDLKDPSDAQSAKTVVLKTCVGDIKINMYPGEAPKTVENFVTLGQRGYYNNIIFHRVIKEFVIQAGDPTGTGTGGTSIYGSTFPDEINSHKIVKGTLAMANRGANTNSSQFYIVTASDQPSLDGKYTAFGQVADDASQAVVEKIAAVDVDANDKPLQAIRITGFEIIQK